MNKRPIQFFLLLFAALSGSFVQAQSAAEQLRLIKQRQAKLTEEQATLTDSLENVMLRHVQDLLDGMGFPSEGEVVRHPGFALQYVEAHEQARWVMHVILPDIRDGREGRTNRFMEDPKISTGSAQERDYFIKEMKPDSSGYKYTGFGFDRGHLAPSADFKWSKKALAASYYYSNMSPQRGALNRERWAELEGLLREVVLTHDQPLYVVTGPVLLDTLPVIKRSVNGLTIPYHYWKVAYDPARKQAIGFVMPNQTCPHPPEWYAVSVDSVEKLTGLNFFQQLPDSIEQRVEASFQVPMWLPERQQGEVLPLAQNRLPRGALNTKGLKQLFPAEGPKATICGTVVSATRSKKGHVFLNFDKKFPNQVFSVNIWESNLRNFPYAPEVELMQREICVTGKLHERDGVAGMNVEREEQIFVLEEDPY